MVLVTAFPLQVDLLPLTKALWAHDLAHQIVEQDNQQQLWLINPAQLAVTLSLCEQFAQGELPQKSATSNTKKTRQWRKLLRKTPVTAGLLVITLGLALLTNLGNNYSLVAPFSFFLMYITPEPYLIGGWQHLFTQPWRLITPIWLHFGILHLVFNSLWWWELGRRIELQQSGQKLLWLLLLTAILSNLAQAWQGINLFGGLSGVIYGLLGYIWLWDKLNKPVFLLPEGIVIFMLVWLVLGFTDVLAMVGAGNMANMAHLGGLLSGLGLALILTMLESRNRNKWQ
jgi:GlpG protein